ncbi:MAG: hypothetical protein D6738_06165 [Acidobacteria bacterium]|nr:MAG: hypothetical protein D6738_06165 [Acidobacteriota bacterium]
MRRGETGVPETLEKLTDETSAAAEAEDRNEAAAAAAVEDDPLAAILNTEPEVTDADEAAELSGPGEPAVDAPAPVLEETPSAEHLEPPFDRREFLAPYLEPIAAALEAAEELDDDQELVLQFAGEEVRIDAWARSIAAQVLLDEDGGVGNDSASRIVEAIALEAKIREDLARYRIASSLALPGGGPAEDGQANADVPVETIRVRAPDHIQQDIIHDAALGFALLSEMQRVIDASVVHGRMEQAKALSAFRPNVSHALIGIRELLDEQDRAVAQQMAEALRCVPDDAELPEIQPRRRRRRRMSLDSGTVTPTVRPAREASPRRVRLMVMTLIGLVGLWCALILPRLLQERLPEFSLSDFRKVQTVIAVTARPPSLYVTVDANAWARLKRRQKENVVREIAFDLQRAGYTGARFMTANGRTVAQWLRARGVEIIDERQEGDPKAGKP